MLTGNAELNSRQMTKLKGKAGNANEGRWDETEI